MGETSVELLGYQTYIEWVVLEGADEGVVNEIIVDLPAWHVA
jgi:hypothetical protein